MKTTPAQEGWFGRTHRTAQLWQVGPSDGLLDGSVRTSTSHVRPIDSCAERPSGVSTAISTALCGAVATAGANRGRNTGGSDPLRVDPTGGSAAAVCPPAHRQRVCGEPQRRLIDCCSPSTAAVGCGAISCIHGKVPTKCVNPCGRASDLGELA